MIGEIELSEYFLNCGLVPLTLDCKGGRSFLRIGGVFAWIQGHAWEKEDI